MLRHIVLTLLLLALPLNAAANDLQLSSSVSLDGATQIDFLPVEEAYQLSLEVSSPQSLRLYWQIAPEYYLYKKRFDFKFEQDDQSIPLEVTFPKGIERDDEYFGLSEVYYHNADITLQLGNAASSGILTVTSQGCADAGLCYPPQTERFSVGLQSAQIAPLEPAPRTRKTAAPGAPLTTAAPASLLQILTMVLLAFAGGSILNLMPCVFPVLSLKVYSFATGDDSTRHTHGWVYAVGVVASFLLVGALLIGLQQAGSAIGWGFQLQSPRFVAALAFLFFTMALALSGLVELGSGMMGTGSKLADKGGYAGSFFTGVLATVVASPCTAPFMGVALGFAVTQPAPIALLVFGALGAGMAAPLLALSYSQRLRQAMPKPGAWMETFKQILAFPLYATAIWLLWVVGRQTGVNGISILLAGMLLLALGLWLWRYAGWPRLFSALFTVLALSAIASPLVNRAPESTKPAAANSNQFSQAYLQQLMGAGQPVFVNVTADWCITCIANERIALSTDAVQDAFASRGIVYLKADWTNYDPAIADYLASHGRTGIPLYLVYDPKQPQKPEILPQLLTPATVIEALERIN
ncbi:protein-disulfide reductase DsbD [Halieaceae bacterium IMCC14734]|uniref:Protein-disulfide reductase DsbD n=1 Tax=Candidatus Litorirhabdus singularis TaxID=2518993 RepID=A0ABT3TLY2_9GAMM|nr:protein-disulfide reductase DsbD [Candidatus Litorirhabdus singularis]MCX2983338.1 protein-disulfide reductase DsbD [Candidatus Litorirhabdus singularis]